MIADLETQFLNPIREKYGQMTLEQETSLLEKILLTNAGKEMVVEHLQEGKSDFEEFELWIDGFNLHNAWLQEIFNRLEEENT